MVNLDVFDNLGPFWAHLDTIGPLQTKINLLPVDKVELGGGAFEQKVYFCLKWCEKGTDEPERAPNGQKHLQGVPKKSLR